MNDQIDIRTKEIYLRNEYACGCVTNKCPPDVTCNEHDAALVKIEELKREAAQSKEMKHSQDSTEVKALGVGVSDNLGEHWDDKVN